MKRRVTEMDREAGRRLKERREYLGIAQSEVAALLGVSFQQVQKYERGTNRIPASKLYVVAKRLDVQMEYFFERRATTDGR